MFRPLKRTKRRWRRMILAWFARQKGDHIVYCRPSNRELAEPGMRRARKGTDGKVIYDSVEDASDAASALLAVGGSDRITVYRCGRWRRRPHYHLAHAVSSYERRAHRGRRRS